MSKRLDKIKPYSPNYSVTEIELNNEKNSSYLKILSSKKISQNFSPSTSQIPKNYSHDSRFSYSQNSIFKNIELIQNSNFDIKNSTFPRKKSTLGIAGSGSTKERNSRLLPEIDTR